MKKYIPVVVMALLLTVSFCYATTTPEVSKKPKPILKERFEIKPVVIHKE